MSSDIWSTNHDRYAVWILLCLNKHFHLYIIQKGFWTFFFGCFYQIAQQGVDRAAGRECGGRLGTKVVPNKFYFYFFAEMFLTTNTLTVIGGKRNSLRSLNLMYLTHFVNHISVMWLTKYSQVYYKFYSLTIILYFTEIWCPALFLFP